MTRYDALALVKLAMLAAACTWVMFVGVRLYCELIVSMHAWLAPITALCNG